MEKPEILAPAGSYDSLMAAIGSGADAVYLGGSAFGARAYAKNLTTEQLKEAIDYTHYHGKRLYLTVNTLLKEREQKEQLYHYILPYYEKGVDAVIVQDMGVLRFLHRVFPDLPLHASTQMTITSTEAAKFLKRYGVTRIVPARELSLAEIKKLGKACGLEIECFVHGALCYCYSGQCLLSSMIGGRSGNRGRCAQPCRLPYELQDFKGTNLNKKDEIYRLSPKDLCALFLIPEMVKAGITSFKIEGRMKKTEYVAAVTEMYRKYLDLYWERQEEPFKVQEKDYKTLMELYNRGGFTDGYYQQHNGREMMAMKRPNHQGIFVGKIEKIQKNQIIFQCLEEIHKKDVLEIRNGQEVITELTSSHDCAKGKQLVLNANQIKKLRQGQSIYRMKNKYLIESMEAKWSVKEKRIPLHCQGFFVVGQPSILKISGQGVKITIEGAKVEIAQRQPLEEEKLKELLGKTGGTEYYFESFDLSVEKNIFLPVQAIKELRRKGIIKWEQAVSEKHSRKKSDKAKIEQLNILENVNTMEKKHQLEVAVSVFNQDQLEEALKITEVDWIYLELSTLTMEEAVLYGKRIQESGKKCGLALAQIFRTEAEIEWEQKKKNRLDKIFQGYLIRNLEEFVRLGKEDLGDREWILDSMLYQYNQEAIQFYHENIGQHVLTTVLPLELNYQELQEMGYSNGEVIVYGRVPVMVSAQCQWKQNGICTKRNKSKTGSLVLKDRLQNKFPVINSCKYCYNTIYNSQPINLLDQKNAILDLLVKRIRIQLIDETKEQTQKILKETISIFKKEVPILESKSRNSGTRGHWKRGVE